MYIDKETSGGCNISDSLLRRMSCGCGERADEECSNGTQCGVSAWGLNGYPLAMVYTPVQEFCELYDLDTALNRGTLFKQLDLPFEGESVSKGGCCRG